jgi:hypothetical protein
VGDQEAQKLLVGLRARGLAGVRLGDAGNQAIGLIEVHLVPGPQPVAQADHLSVAGDRSQWNGIDVVEDDPLAGLQRLPPVAVGPQAGGEDLLDLLAR